jgi:hypothetical protein
MNTLDYWSLRQLPFADGVHREHPFFGPPQRDALAAIHDFFRQDRQIAMLVAPSGCGSTTLLHWVAAASGIGQHAIETVQAQGPAKSPADAMRKINERLLSPFADSALGQPLTTTERANDLDPNRISRLFGALRHLDALRRRGIVPFLLIDRADAPFTHAACRIVESSESARILLAVRPAQAGPIADMADVRPLTIPLRPLTEDESRLFVRHELATAGGRPSLFDPFAIRALHDLGDGRIATISSLARRALVIAADAGNRCVTPADVESASRREAQAA